MESQAAAIAPGRRERLLDGQYDLPLMYVHSVVITGHVAVQFAREARPANKNAPALDRLSQNLTGLMQDVRSIQLACATVEQVPDEVEGRLSDDEKERIRALYKKVVDEFTDQMSAMDDRAAEAKKRIKGRSVGIEEMLETINTLIKETDRAIGQFGEGLKRVHTEVVKDEGGPVMYILLRSINEDMGPPPGIYN